jgi:AraC family transcriptional regulator, activator of mtrCDE
MHTNSANLGRLLPELDVNVEALAICQVRQGVRLILPPVEAIEVHYVLEGTLHLIASESASLICEPGSVITVPLGTSQSVAADNKSHEDEAAEKQCSTSRDRLLLYDAGRGKAGDIHLVSGVVEANVSGSFGFLNHVTEPMVRNLFDAPILDQTFAAMLDEVVSCRPGRRAVLGAANEDLLVKVLRGHVNASGSQAMQRSYLRAPRLHKALAAVLAKPAAAFNVAALASIAGMSRSAFAEEFLAAFAMTPMEFVRRTRLNQAAELLRSTTTPVKVIADRVGFASRSHFSIAFRDVYGTDPRNFRRAAFNTKPKTSDPLRSSVRPAHALEAGTTVVAL